MKQALLIAIFRNRPLHELHGGWCERGRTLDLPYSIMKKWKIIPSLKLLHWLKHQH